MTWSVRHAGSPRWISGLSADAVRDDIAAGRWEPDDEVRGPAGDWQALEAHPEFAGAVAEAEPPARESEDDTRLDMNPLIDVCLVLLIFFILTTTYETMRKVLDMPGATAARQTPGVRRTREEVKKSVIWVEVRAQGGKPTFKVEGQTVEQPDLAAAIVRFAKGTGKRHLLLDAQGVEWGTVVAVMDAARSAGVEKTLLATRSEK